MTQVCRVSGHHGFLILHPFRAILPRLYTSAPPHRLDSLHQRSVSLKSFTAMMSRPEVETIELPVHPTTSTLESAQRVHGNDIEVPAFAIEAIPDGGYGWIVILACSVVIFMMNG